MLPPGNVLETAAPAVQHPRSAEIRLRADVFVGKSRAVPVTMSSTRPAVSIGLRASIIAAVPETSGAAKLVPSAAT